LFNIVKKENKMISKTTLLKWICWIIGPEQLKSKKNLDKQDAKTKLDLNCFCLMEI
jgi:hypothetical protein